MENTQPVSYAPFSDPLVRIFDGFFPDSYCEQIIKFFKNNTNLHRRLDTTVYNFTDLNLSSIDPITHQSLRPYFDKHANKYFTDLQLPKNCVPQNWEYEHIRIKSYDPIKTDVFRPHTDVANHASARRFLVMMVYLNDVEEGGETEFYGFNNFVLGKVSPRKGRLVCFPPLWTHPHAGLAPISNIKYTLQTYLHYI